VLVVEDEEAIRDAVATGLRSEGYTVDAVPDGRDLSERLRVFRPDLVLLDWMLPGTPGVELARVVRRHGDVAVVMLTARDEVADRVRGFDAGADDYVVKPFAMAELLARIKAVLRRLGRVPATIEVGDLLVDEDAATATRAGRPLELTATEFRLLAYLAAHRGRTLSKTQILTQVWGYEDYDPNLVEVYVSGLRRKTEALGPRLLHTVRGLGYTLRA
jgi:DNA-binding response OmpR family regulator